jgi:outer membrane protein assembly factor BamB
MKLGGSVALLLLFGLLAFISPSSAVGGLDSQEWPTHRGDWARTGLARVEIPAELELLWEFPGEWRVLESRSSPAVTEGKVFFTAVNVKEGSPSFGYLYFYALDAENGSVIWYYRGGRDAGGGVHPAPTVIDGTVYVGDEDYLYAFDAETGEIKWRFEVPKIPGLRGVDGAPVVVDNRVYFGCWSGWFFCVDANTGELIWEYSDGEGRVWQGVRIPSMGHVTEAPSLVNGVVYFGTAAGMAGYTGWVYALNAENGSLIWKFHIGDEIFSSPAIVDNVLYIGAGYFGHLPGDGMWALDAHTGELLWYFDTENQMITSTPVVVDGKVIFGSKYNESIYALSAEDGSVLWSTHVGETWFWNSPVVANGTVFIGVGYDLYVMRVEDGSIVARYYEVGLLSGSPAIAHDKIFIAGSRGLLAFGARPQPPGLALDWPLLLAPVAIALVGLAIYLFRRSRAALPEF